ncbi:aromatic acid exporter family protein, partial [Patulibacter sp. S7RM1-6]
RRRAALQALKAAVAAGVAWWLGGRLPAPLGPYAYYAALGAMLVVHPALVDSFRATVQIVGAILVGAVLAAVVQALGGTTGVTVAVVVAVGSALSLLPGLGEQRTWVPFAALFVLTVGGEHPTDYVLGYAGQILAGAAVGLLVNLAVLPPTELSDLRDATERLRRRLATRLEWLADRLDDEAAGSSGLGDELVDLQPAVQRVRATAELARRAR